MMVKDPKRIGLALKPSFFNAEDEVSVHGSYVRSFAVELNEFAWPTTLLQRMQDYMGSNDDEPVAYHLSQEQPDNEAFVTAVEVEEDENEEEHNEDEKEDRQEDELQEEDQDEVQEDEDEGEDTEAYGQHVEEEEEDLLQKSETIRLRHRNTNSEDVEEDEDTHGPTIFRDVLLDKATHPQQGCAQAICSSCSEAI
jgi:hypothetical protein